jgi:MocE subfamily Rieske [2Fe-2S] domain protein
VYGFTQHAGLAENVLDHRLNCRTVKMNFVHRYLYWNMNYHLEHHMFPLVPYHALPRLHELVKDDCPTPYGSILEAYREIVPAVLRQIKDPGYYVRRKLPQPAPGSPGGPKTGVFSSSAAADKDGWVPVCPVDKLQREDVVRFDHGNRSYALYQTADGSYYATDGFCTHGNAHLADGFVKGRLIECPKHNGRFDITDGSPQRGPVCVALRTYAVRAADSRLWINLARAGGKGTEESSPVYSFRVVSNRNVATFIKELVLEPEPSSPRVEYRSGEYLQFLIPAYERILFADMDIAAPFSEVWKAHHVYDLVAVNPEAIRRNYSFATNPGVDRNLRFNVRISTPPRGQACDPGRGSSYIFSLKPGDTVSAVGPFGDFHVKETANEMIYIGGGAGMAPLRSHLSHLFDTQGTKRPVSFWYGARSLQELFYNDYFSDLSRRHPNFRFNVALSEPEERDGWTSHTGFIHQVLFDEYLKSHKELHRVEFYLCGPPPLIKATKQMLKALNVRPDQIAYDEFN